MLLDGPMHSIMFIVLLSAVSFIFQSASGLWAGSIYTWTDKNGAVHITDTPPPPGAAVEDVRGNPPESPAPVQPIPPQSIENPEIQAEPPAGPAGPRAAGDGEQKAAETETETQQPIRPSEEVIDTHDHNPRMRQESADESKQAAEAAQTAEAKPQEAAGQMQPAEQNAAAAQQQVQGAQEDAAVFKECE